MTVGEFTVEFQAVSSHSALAISSVGLTWLINVDTESAVLRCLECAGELDDTILGVVYCLACEALSPFEGDLALRPWVITPRRVGLWLEAAQGPLLPLVLTEQLFRKFSDFLRAAKTPAVHHRLVRHELANRRQLEQACKLHSGKIEA